LGSQSRQNADVTANQQVAGNTKSLGSTTSPLARLLNTAARTGGQASASATQSQNELNAASTMNSNDLTAAKANQSSNLEADQSNQQATLSTNSLNSSENGMNLTRQNNLTDILKYINNMKNPSVSYGSGGYSNDVGLGES
jgi:type VI protein secretion system component VasK